jgi:hypothetical protein
MDIFIAINGDKASIANFSDELLKTTADSCSNFLCEESA